MHAPLANPFALMVEPGTVLEAMGSSAQLNALRSKRFQPLDKPRLVAAEAGAVAAAAEFDEIVDTEDAAASEWQSDLTGRGRIDFVNTTGRPVLRLGAAALVG
jgi:hypothetical protein